MKRLWIIGLGILAWGVLFGCLLLPQAWAGEVIITMSDEQIQATLKQVGTWRHAWKDGMTYASDTELGVVIVDQLVEAVSLGHYHSLAEIGGTLEIRYDQPRELVVP